MLLHSFNQTFVKHMLLYESIGIFLERPKKKKKKKKDKTRKQKWVLLLKRVTI